MADSLAANTLPASIRLLAATDLGQIKVVEGLSAPGGDLKVLAVWGPVSRAASISCMAVESSGNVEDRGRAPLLAVGRKSGTCCILGSDSGIEEASLPSDASSSEDVARQEIAGLHFMQSSQNQASERSLKLLTCTHGGLVRTYTRQQPDGRGAQSDSSLWEETQSFRTKANVLAIAVDEPSNSLAVACKGSHLEVWDSASGSVRFQAKGHKPNRVGLMDAPWNTAIAFQPLSGGQRVLVGTGHHKLLMYEMTKRRPCFAVGFREAKITALAPESNGHRCWVADGRGEIGCLDLRSGSFLCTLKGVGGSIGGLSLNHHPPPMLASVGLDRFLRIHSLDTRKVVAKAYLKQQLTAVAFCASPKLEKAEEEEEDSVAVADPTVADFTERRKRRNSAAQRVGMNGRHQVLVAAAEKLKRPKLSRQTS